MKKILITGGAGFIGSYLVERLLNEKGYKIFVIDNLHPQVHGPNALIPERLKHPLVEFHRADITDKDKINDLVSQINPEIVVHLASETGTGQSYDEIARYCGVNMMGTAHLLECLRRSAPDFKKIILSSSRAVYGEGAWVDKDGRRVFPVSRDSKAMSQGQFCPQIENETLSEPARSLEEDTPHPVSIYGATKLFQEYLCRLSLEGSSFKSVILRFQNVYGPGQSLQNPYTGVLSIFSSQILAQKKLYLYEDGEISRDFVFVEDVIEALFSSLQRDLPNGIVINIGSGERTTVRDAAVHLLQFLGADADSYEITSEFRIGDIRQACADVDRAQALLGWKPKTSLQQGLRKLSEWIVRNR
jgi:dTDP-L-rhamnose 4-epimerase